MVFEKILVPLDGSTHSMHALKEGIEIAKNFDGKITLIHVYSKHLVAIPETLAHLEGVPRLIEAAHGTGVDILSDGETRVKTEGVPVETLLREGHTASEIVEMCEEGNFDLIVMYTTDISGIKEKFVGSVSDEVIRHGHCPVLVVK